MSKNIIFAGSCVLVWVLGWNMTVEAQKPSHPATYSCPNWKPRGKNWHPVFKKHPEFQRLLQEEVRLEKETRSLVKKFKETPENEQKAVRKDLEKTVAEHFQVRQQRRLYELKLMEERIRVLREDIEERDKNAEKIVKKRINDLLDSDPGWKF